MLAGRHFAGRRISDSMFENEAQVSQWHRATHMSVINCCKPVRKITFERNVNRCM